jgi:hypothetical protein
MYKSLMSRLNGRSPVTLLTPAEIPVMAKAAV